MTKPRIQVSWSGGKDSALALHRIIESGAYEIAGLHTVIDKESRRVGIHQIPEELIEIQARAIGLPLTKLYLSKKPLAYEKLMKKYYHELESQGIKHVLFGDIFLDDLKDFRVQLLAPTSTLGVYPLWNENTTLLVNEFLDTGFRTRLCTVDSKYIDSNYVGKFLTKEFIHRHPDIDACGENGEYHSFVVDAPFFNTPLDLGIKERYEQVIQFKMKDEHGDTQSMKDIFYFAEFEYVDSTC